MVVKKRAARHRWFIVMTFVVALMLDILPLPGWAIWFRPRWTLLVLIYWTMALPYVVGIASAFFIGLILDILNGTLLGEHAIAMVMIAYIVMKIYQLIRVYPLFQQTLIVFVLAFSYQLIIFAIQGSINQLPHTMMYWLTIFISTLLWPWVFILLRDGRHRLQVT